MVIEREEGGMTMKVTSTEGIAVKAVRCYRVIPFISGYTATTCGIVNSVGVAVQ